MPEALVLTFAEFEFTLRSGSGPTIPVRDLLRLRPETASDVVAAAGVASLLARGLCVLDDGRVRPTEPITTLTLGLATAVGHTEAVGWIGDRTVLLQLFGGPSVRVAVLPGAYGQFAVELMSPAEPVMGPLTRFIDRCVTDEGASAVLVHSTEGGRDVSAAVAVDECGGWFVSDSQETPDRSVACTRELALERVGELLDGGQPWP
ncbi:hypothetical protein R8Z50_01465 [Longispora sp. K20-0274]|uniref:hypothetical protein n=1 Tax=Longispora sp. K20-0274 TaxID=3088255 RepID=UPI0039996F7F